DLFDPEFAGQTIGETIGTVVTSTATGIAGTLLGGPVAGAVSAAAPIFIIETGSAYNEMIDRGIDPEQASRAAINIGTINAVIEQASLFPLFKSLGISKIARRKMVKGITDEMVKRARLGNIPKTGGVQFITEGLEEVTQTLNQIGQTNQLIKDTDKKIKGDEVVEQVIKSFYGGALIGGGLGGGAGVIGTVKARGEIGKAKRAEVQADDAGKAATLKAIGEAILLERITKAKEIFEANGFTDETRDALIKDVTGKDNLESLNDAEMRDVGRALKESINEGLIYNADRVADTEPEVKEPVVPAAAPAKPKVAKPKVAKPKVAKPDIPAPKTPTEGVKPEVIEPVVPEKPVPEEKVKEIKEAVKDVETNPNEKQIESGNYKKGHVKISGLDVAIENPSGSFRSGVDADGETWNTKMHGHYGYIKRTEGADGEQVDVFINPKTPESDNVFVVFQNDPKTGKFDEHKVMMGYQSPSQAKRGYLSNYEQGWKGLGSIEEMTHDEFKAWLKSDKPKKTPKRVKPVAEPTAPAAKPKVAKPKVAKPKVAKPKVEELAVQKPVQKPVQKVPVTPTPADAKAKKGESHKKGKITIKEIRRSIIEDFGVPLRVGKFRKKVKGGERLGMFKIKPEVIRTAEYHDLPTISHELAHFIDKKWNLKGLRERSPELAGLDYDPSKRRTSEGFAEYIRYWVTGSADPTVIAPKFTVKFNEFLDKDNELRTKLNRVKNNITTWREQGAAERLYSQIDFDGKQSIKNFGRFLKRTTYEIRRLLEDDLIFLDRFERQVMGVKSISGAVRDLIINPAVSPTALARHSAKTAEARAESMVLDGVFDFSGQDVYKSLVEILRPVRDDIKNFITYGISKRSIELHGRAIQPGFDLGDALYFVNKFETEIFKKVHKEFKEFQDRVFQITIDAGVISVKQAEVILSLNVEYIPLKRSFERGEIESAFTGVGNKIAHPGSPIKKIKGSGRAVVNPLQSVIQNTAQIISASDKTRIIRAIVKLVESKEGFGNWVENIPIPKVPVKITLESMKKSLSDVGIDVDNNVDMEQILTFYTNGRQYSGKDNVISFWHDGKMKLYELDPDLYKTLKAIDKVQLPPIIDFIFGKPARAVRAGATGYRAGFALITNPMHDIFGMALQTEYARAATTPYISMRAIIKRIKGRKNDKIVKLFKRSGVEFGNFVGIDRKNLQSAVDS
nr:hypothetical protein [bacterium]